MREPFGKGIYRVFQQAVNERQQGREYKLQVSVIIPCFFRFLLYLRRVFSAGQRIGNAKRVVDGDE